jgi:hypothetical protein
VEGSERGEVEGATAYVFLRGVLSERVVSQTTAILRHVPVAETNHNRKSIVPGDKRAGGTMLGWKDGVRLAPSAKYEMLDTWLFMPVLWEMSNRFAKYLPDEWKQQAKVTRASGDQILGGMMGNPDLPRLGVVNPIFSSITINRNIQFESHEDKGNVEGTLSCLATFGRFSGGLLCLPRLRIAFDVQPGDLLIAATGREQHGLVGGRAGERWSVVAYLRG